ncbi:DUF2790 domain-containing protein [Pseudomonas sp.]|uniref:DUF2790 domain-containing protein n=1 Tax=Pseudomonas sp. TaxID=306 RepID=UPI003C752B92
MTLSKAFAIATLTFGTSMAAFAQPAIPYQYGMDLDITQVIALDAPASEDANIAILTYRDSAGNVQKVSYIRPNISANQN